MEKTCKLLRIDCQEQNNNPIYKIDHSLTIKVPYCWIWKEEVCPSLSCRNSATKALIPHSYMCQGVPHVQPDCKRLSKVQYFNTTSYWENCSPPIQVSPWISWNSLGQGLSQDICNLSECTLDQLLPSKTCSQQMVPDFNVLGAIMEYWTIIEFDTILIVTIDPSGLQHLTC